MIPYQVTYNEAGRPVTLKFYPNWCNSNGLYWEELGRKALRLGKFDIPRWSCGADGCLTYTESSSFTNYTLVGCLVEEAQALVTELMDKLVEWDSIRNVFKGLKGE